MYYRQFGLVHGDIQPWTVHLNQELEVVLMDNPLLFPRFGDCLSKSLSNSAYRGAFSPLQLQSLVRRENYFGHDPLASEVWAIGITALCYASLKDLNQFYDWHQKVIRFDSIAFEIDRLFRGGYSRNLINLFSLMLSYDERQRPSFDSILSCTSVAHFRPSLQSVNNPSMQMKLIDSFEGTAPMYVFLTKVAKT